jgi:metallo-beta-lactamase family protein
MISYLSCQDVSKVKKMFLVHGDLPVMEFFRNKLEEKGFGNVYIPEKGESVEIN